MTSPNHSKGLLTMLTVATAMAIPPTTGWAADTPPASDRVQQPWEKVSIKFGGFLSTFDSSLEFGLTGLGGIKIDGESVLGLDSTLTVLRVDALYRPGRSRRHQIDFNYAGYRRSGRSTLTEEIEIDGETLVQGTRIESTLNFNILRGSYSYALLQDDRMRIALGLGVYVVPLRYGVNITTEGDDRDLEFRDVTLPLPSLALRGEFQLVPKLFLESEINAMYLEAGGFKGSLIDTSLGLEYRPWNHFGFGIAYNAMTVKVEGEQEADYLGADFVGAVDINFSGLMLYGKVSF